MERPCDVCGTTYTATRASSRYCSERCKKRAQRAPATQRSDKRRQARPNAAVVPMPQPDVTAGVAESTRRKLDEMGRLDTPLGQATMVLARRLDRPSGDTGAGLASLAKQLAAMLAAATADVRPAGDLLTELRARRDRKLGHPEGRS
jgi:hypothetical protein